MHGADQGRGRARLLREERQGAGHRVGDDEATDRHVAEDGHGQPGDPTQSPPGIEGQPESGGGSSPGTVAKQALGPPFRHQARVDEIQHHQPKDIGAKEQAIGLRRHLVVIDVSKRGSGDKGIATAVVKAAGEGIAQQASVHRQGGIVFHCHGQRRLAAARRCQGFGQVAHGDQGHDPHDGQHPEDPSPGPVQQQLPPEQRPEQRRDRHHQDQGRQHLGRPLPGIEITDHGPGQHGTGASPKSLNDAPHQHLRGGLGQSTTH
ncbi:hypothetical protein D3C77_384570 [compost metagenome]